MVKRIGKALGVGLTAALVASTPVLADTVYDIPDNSAFKSYMSYKCITKKDSRQYSIQQKSITDENGFRKYNDLYCVAVGTGFHAPVGTHIDVTLSTGRKLSCIVSDIKDNKHTDSTNRQVAKNGNVVEFIVDTKELDGYSKRRGDVSYVPGLEGSVDYIVVKSGGIDPELTTGGDKKTQETEHGIIVTKPFDMVEERLAEKAAANDSLNQPPEVDQTDILESDVAIVASNGIQATDVNGEVVMSTDVNAGQAQEDIQAAVIDLDPVNMYGEYDDVTELEAVTEEEDQTIIEIAASDIDAAAITALSPEGQDAGLSSDEVASETVDVVAEAAEVQVEVAVEDSTDKELTKTLPVPLDELKTVEESESLEKVVPIEEKPVAAKEPIDKTISAEEKPVMAKEPIDKIVSAEEKPVMAKEPIDKTISAEEKSVTDKAASEEEAVAEVKSEKEMEAVEEAAAADQTEDSGQATEESEESYVDEESELEAVAAISTDQELTYTAGDTGNNSHHDLKDVFEYEVVDKEIIEENGESIYKIIYCVDGRRCSFTCDKSFFDSYAIGCYISLADMG